MKKGKKLMIVVIGIICFILSLIIFMQFKVVSKTDITGIENMRETELRAEILEWKEKYEELDNKYQETIQKIQEYDKETATDTENANLLREELEQANMIAGKTDIEGKGIIVTINESEESNKAQLLSYLLLTVNSLKGAGSEAISINNQRIVNMSDIVLIGDKFFKVNGQKITAPYEIKAIGNQTYLESAILGNGGSVDELKKLGYDVSTEKNKIIIYKYEDEFNIKYIN